MKNEGGREAGKSSKVVPDLGDRCLFIFLWSRRLFCNVFPFPVCKAQLIDNWYENRRGARNTVIFLIIRQYYGRTDTPCANSNGGPNTKKNYWRTVPGQHCLLAEGYIGAPIYWRTEYKKCTEILGFWVGKARQPTEVLAHFHAKNKKRRTEQFSALRLFSSQAPINLAYKQETEIRWRTDDGHIKN